MKYTDIPGIAKPISRLVQGSVMLTTDDVERGFDLLDAALEQGYNTFDTAPLYHGGQCERVLGQWMDSRGNREQIVIISKSAHHNIDRKRVTPFDIAADMHDSLARLQTDYVDLHLLHRDDPDIPVGSIIGTLNEHLSEGRIHAFGASNWRAERIREANDYATTHNLTPMVASSPHYSLAEQTEEPWEECESITGAQNESSREWYGKTQLALIPWSSLSGGFLSGRTARNDTSTMMEPNRQAFCNEENFRRLDRVRELAAERGKSVPQIALAWILHQPLNIFPIVGGETAEETQANLHALDLQLTGAELDWLNLRSETKG